MAGLLGKDCITYRNTGTWASPTWVAITNIKDLTLGVEKATADASTRASAWRKIMTGLLDGTIDWQMVWDTSDAGFTAIKDAFFDGTTIELLILDGAYTVAGSQGLRADFEVTTFTRNEPLEEAVTVDVSVKPGATVNTTTWYTAT